MQNKRTHFQNSKATLKCAKTVQGLIARRSLGACRNKCIYVSINTKIKLDLCSLLVFAFSTQQSSHVYYIICVLLDKYVCSDFSFFISKICLNRTFFFKLALKFTIKNKKYASKKE